jgi:hypothetical protein
MADVEVVDLAGDVVREEFTQLPTRGREPRPQAPMSPTLLAVDVAM